MDWLNKLIYNYREKRQAKCKSVYLIVCYAHWCVREFKWTGRWVKYKGKKYPEVYDWTDYNGAYAWWFKTNILHTTTGFIDSFSFNETTAKQRVEFLEKDKERMFNYQETE